jgi:hypothetical protein
MATAKTTPTFKHPFLVVAETKLGAEEAPRGSNWGPEVKIFLASVGITFPASWCAAFVYWTVEQVFKARKIPNPLTKTGGVLALWNSTPKAMKFSKPQSGDIFIMDFGSGHGHTGFVDTVTGDRFTTIEGNSNDEGSREGYEVCRKPNGRPISSCKGFIRVTV